MFHNFFEYASLWTIGIHEIDKNWGNRNSIMIHSNLLVVLNIFFSLWLMMEVVFWWLTTTLLISCPPPPQKKIIYIVYNRILPIQNDHRNIVCYRLSPRELIQRISEKFSVCCVRCMSSRLRIRRPNLPACWESSRSNAKIWWFWSFDNTRISATKSFNVRNRSWKVRLMSLHES